MGAAGSVVKGPTSLLSPDQSSDQSLAFPKNGVKLSFVEAFFTLCGGRSALEAMTTTDVCQNFIKPYTNDTQTSYCELLLLQQHEAVGIATVFISHAWKYQFLDVIDALLFHFKNEPDIVIWFDLFSNNQHKAIDLDFHWWCNTFKSAIQMFGRTVMVLAPWSDPIPFTRGWCLFELYCTADTNSLFEVAMSQLHQAQFLHDMSKDGQKAMDKMLATINAERSECFRPEDLERIFEAVRRTVGFAGINKMVLEQMRNWASKVTMIAIKEETDDVKILGLESTLANLLDSNGKYDDAETQVLLYSTDTFKHLYYDLEILDTVNE